MRRRNAASNRTIVPIIEEEIKVGKRTVESGRVLINKRVEERQQVIDEPLLQEEVLIKRVPMPLLCHLSATTKANSQVRLSGLVK